MESVCENSIWSLGNHNSRACVQDVTVRDSKISILENGVEIKTWQGRSGGVSGVRFDSIRLETVGNPVTIDQFYCEGKGCSNRSSAVFVRDLVYQNIHPFNQVLQSMVDRALSKVKRSQSCS